MYSYIASAKVQPFFKPANIL